MSAEPRDTSWSGLVLIAGGISLVISTLGGYFVGTVLDHKYATGMHWTIICTAVGTILGFFDLYLIASRLLQAQPPISPRATTDEEEEQADRRE